MVALANPARLTDTPEDFSMSRVPDFYSINEAARPADKRIYHNEGNCPPGRDIKAAGKDRPGQNGYRLCEDCIARGWSPSTRRTAG